MKIFITTRTEAIDEKNVFKNFVDEEDVDSNFIKKNY